MEHLRRGDGPMRLCAGLQATAAARSDVEVHDHESQEKLKGLSASYLKLFLGATGMKGMEVVDHEAKTAPSRSSSTTMILQPGRTSA